MISEENNPAAKRLKRCDEETTAIRSQINQQGFSSSNCEPAALCNGQVVLEATASGTGKVDTQDILAKACNAIGLGSSMIELTEPINGPGPTAHFKGNGQHYPPSGYFDNRNNGNLHNGYRSYPPPYYTDAKTYMDGYHGYSNGYKDQSHSYNKHQPRKYFLSTGVDKIHQQYPYPRNQYAWQSINKSQSHSLPNRIQHPGNRACIPVQQPYRFSYPNGIAQNGTQNNYLQPDGRRYVQQYSNACQRSNSDQFVSQVSSCRFPPPSYPTVNHSYPIQNNFPHSEMSLHQNKAYYGYGNGYPQPPNSDISVNNKISGIENFCQKIDPSKNGYQSQYSPISSPISPTPRPVQQNCSGFEKFNQFQDPQSDRIAPVSNKPISSSTGNDGRAFFPNECYQPPSYKEDYNSSNHIRQSSRHSSYSNGYNTNSYDRNPYSLNGSQNAKQFFSPNGTQLNYSNPENACSYTVCNYNTMQPQMTPENIVHKEASGYSNFKQINNIPCPDSVASRITPIDYSVYGTDEINKNSVKDSKLNLPHSPHIELTPLEGTSIITNISEVSRHTLPEISINSIKPVTAQEKESSQLKDDYTCNRISNANTNGLQNLSDASSCSVINDGVCDEGRAKNKDSSLCYEKDEQYAGIPELTSITDADTRQEMEYPDFNIRNITEVPGPVVKDEMFGANTFIMSQPLKINRVLNMNFIGHPKHRPASEPLFPQSWNTFDEMKRPLSVPAKNIGVCYDNSISLPPEERIKINNFQQKLRPVLEHLLSIPEASSLLSLRENPRELLKHLVKLWGGTTAVSSSKIPLINIKENFLMLVKLLFKATLLLEWGWQNATADRILDDLVTPVDGDLLGFRASLELMKLVTPPEPESCNELLSEQEFSNIAEECPVFMYE